MIFWQLTSIFRDDPATLERVLSDHEWQQYLAWFKDIDELVDRQNRNVLDAEVPRRLSACATRACKLQFQIHGGYLRLDNPEMFQADTLSAFEVWSRYGGTAIEDTLEYGSFRLPISSSEANEGDCGSGIRG